ncbi:MAG: hypothetical protein HZB53_15920 [Chloroflexi bacterium]|nr:hypothetical protein [Chloroflexota bacterium]
MSMPSDLTAAPRSRARGLLLLSGVLLLAGTVLLWSYYLATRQPLSRMVPAAKALSSSIKPHYLFSIYGMEQPLGVAVDPAGERLYVTESDGERLVRVFDGDGKALFSFAPPSSSPASRSPGYVTLDSSGRVFVSDIGRHTVDIYDAGGNYQNSMAPALKDGWFPLGLRYIGGTLYLTDITDAKHRVVALKADGTPFVTFGREGHESGELWFPNSAVADGDGRIYVGDSNNGRVQVFDRQGQVLSMIPGFSLPRGMAIDAEQRLYVVDAVAQEVEVYDTTKAQAELLFRFGDFGLGDGQFNYPNDIAIDGSGRLYITDRASNRVQVWVY